MVRLKAPLRLRTHELGRRSITTALTYIFYRIYSNWRMKKNNCHFRIESNSADVGNETEPENLIERHQF